MNWGVIPRVSQEQLYLAIPLTFVIRHSVTADSHDSEDPLARTMPLPAGRRAAPILGLDGPAPPHDQTPAFWRREHRPCLLLMTGMVTDPRSIGHTAGLDRILSDRHQP